MNLFLDTNVIIGYCIEIDHWYHYAEKLFNNENLYWSTRVKEESDKKLRQLRGTYNRFFILIEEGLNEDYITEEEFFDVVQSIKCIGNKKVSFNTKDLAGHIWTKGGWFEGTSTKNLIEILDSILFGIKITMNQNFKYCNETLNLYERNYDPNYLKLENDLKSLKEGIRKIHSPDNKILVDCHDLSLSKHLNMVFITGDGDIKGNYTNDQYKKYYLSKKSTQLL